MIGKSTLVWLCLATIASGILYHTSYRVQEEQEHLASLNRQIAQERQSIQVLHAEWAYLNDPSQLQRLVDAHTGLRPTRTNQLVSLNALPQKQAPVTAPAASAALVASAAPMAGGPASPDHTPVRSAPVQVAALQAPSARAPLGDVRRAATQGAQVLPAQYATAKYGAAR